MMKKNIVLFVCLVLLTVPVLSYAQQKIKEPTGLFRIYQNGKWGFIDKSGKVVIKPHFDDANSFSEGLAMIEIDRKYGFIDKTGKIVIEPQFKTFIGDRFFSEGLAKIEGEEGHILNIK